MGLYDYVLTEAARRARMAKNELAEAAGEWVEDAKENVSTAVTVAGVLVEGAVSDCLLYTSPSPRD